MDVDMDDEPRAPAKPRGTVVRVANLIEGTSAEDVEVNRLEYTALSYAHAGDMIHRPLSLALDPSTLLKLSSAKMVC